MAVIKAVSSKAGIGHAIDYVTKKEKTEEKLVSGLHCEPCLLYTSPSPRDKRQSRMPSSA